MGSRLLRIFLHFNVAIDKAHCSGVTQFSARPSPQLLCYYGWLVFCANSLRPFLCLSMKLSAHASSVAFCWSQFVSAFSLANPHKHPVTFSVPYFDRVSLWVAPVFPYSTTSIYKGLKLHLSSFSACVHALLSSFPCTIICLILQVPGLSLVCDCISIKFEIFFYFMHLEGVTNKVCNFFKVLLCLTEHYTTFPAGNNGNLSVGKSGLWNLVDCSTCNGAEIDKFIIELNSVKQVKVITSFGEINA